MKECDLLTGRISKFESFGAVDGPGIRFIVFFQGCNLRCACCHNPETWEFDEGEEYTAEDVVNRALKYKDYFGEIGGITFSGGEPLCQAKFLEECAKLCKENGIHTTLDTSGSIISSDVISALKYIDLVLLDIKMTNEDDYSHYTKGSLKQTLDFLELLDKLKIDVWVRQVIIPSINDNIENILKLKDICYKYKNIKKIELLPFKKLCMSKYDTLGIEFKLENTPQCDEEIIKKLNQYIK